MNSKTDLTICMGSACHQMGVFEAVEILKKLLVEHGLQDSVNFKGAFCLGKCGAGIVIEFRGKRILHVRPDTVEAVFNQEILPYFAERIPQ